MKSIVLSSVVTALLLFSGCSDKEVVVEDPSNTSAQSNQVAPAIQSDVVSAQDNMMDESSSMNAAGAMSLSDMQNEFPSVYFAFDQFSLSDTAQSKIETAANVAKDANTDFNIKLEGNCDEWGSDEYNFALGLKRAASVKKALVADGIDASRISMVSFGESNPVCSDKTQECWAKNRRVDFKLLP